MPTRKPPDPTVKPFIEMAGEFGCDEDESTLRKKLGQIARVEPKDDPDNKPRKG
jgi:hypothetical protein